MPKATPLPLALEAATSAVFSVAADISEAHLVVRELNQAGLAAPLTAALRQLGDALDVMRHPTDHAQARPRAGDDVSAILASDPTAGLGDTLSALVEYAEKFGETSEAPSNSAVWEAVEEGRALDALLPLLKSAPTMLAALKAVAIPLAKQSHQLGNVSAWPLLQQVRAAIAEAEGRA